MDEIMAGELQRASGALRISLVICTLNRADILPRCLAAAVRQTLPAAQYEILVVDNGSKDHTRAVVQRLSRICPNVRYIHHSTPGLSHARNAGARAARAPIVHYIDDDAIAAPTLLEEILRIFDSHADAGVGGGRIRVTLPENRPAWFASYFIGYYGELNHPVTGITRCTDMSMYPYGGNIAYRKAALEAAGFFSSRFGRVGADYAGGEEIDCTLRVVKRGYSVYYTPSGVVDHIILPERISWAYISGSAKSAGRNCAYYDMELLGTGARLHAEFSDLRRRAAGWLGSKRGSPDAHIFRSQCVFQWSKFRRKWRYVTTDVFRWILSPFGNANSQHCSEPARDIPRHPGR